MSSTGHWAFELPLLRLQEGALLPHNQLQLSGAEGSAVGLVTAHVHKHRSMYIAAFALNRSAEDTVWKTPQGPIHSVGCVARVAYISHTQENGSATKLYTLVLQGLLRCELQELTFRQDISVCTVHVLKPSNPATREVGVRKHLKGLLLQYFDRIAERAPEQQAQLEKLSEVAQHASLEVLCIMAVLVSAAGPAYRQELLESTDMIASAKRLTTHLHDKLQSTENVAIPDLKAIYLPARTKRGQRLPNSRAAIETDEAKVEVDDNEDAHEIHSLQTKIEHANLPTEAKRVAERELKRLKRLQPTHPEWGVIRSYLECMVELPWSATTPEALDIPQARRKLDEDHYGLERVKKRIVEFLAVMALRKATSGSILCLIGPPGVGKTSLGKSVARAVGRKFARVALGGVHDEAEIRGHRRTYVGAMPGSIIQAVRRAGVANPVILLDEVDKVGQSVRGDPAAALLEVLDPEQNHTFTDHYVDVPFDLSRVLFVCTANQVDRIPAPLLDRMELVEIPGYTSEEKVHIAERYLIPKQLERSGLKPSHITFPTGIVTSLATEYTREAGVRQLERTIGSLCRHVAVDVASQQQQAPGQHAQNTCCVEVSHDLLEEVLGAPKYSHEPAQRHATPGVATGMAVTFAGGELLFIECTRVPGDGKITITGQLGDVMQESARIALSWLRSRVTAAQEAPSGQAGEHIGQPKQHLNHDNFEQALADPSMYELVTCSDVHIHVPAGATPKDGPSAGVAIVAALVSLFTRQCVDPCASMTGEVTLRGLVLPVGGIKDKVLAAHRSGIKRVLLPERNRRDLRDLPADVSSDLTFVFVEDVDQVLDNVLLPSNEQGQRHHTVPVRHAQHTLRSFF